MNAALVAAARAYLGTPFVHQGRSPQGLDCAGLVALALADVGRDVRDVTNYGKTPWLDGFETAVVDNLGEPLPRNTPLEPGDIVLMSNRPLGVARHIAIISDYYLGGLGIIHTRSDIARGAERGRVTEHILDDRYRSRILKAFR